MQNCNFRFFAKAQGLECHILKVKTRLKVRRPFAVFEMKNIYNFSKHYFRFLNNKLQFGDNITFSKDG